VSREIQFPTFLAWNDLGVTPALISSVTYEGMVILKDSSLLGSSKAVKSSIGFEASGSMHSVTFLVSHEFTAIISQIDSSQYEATNFSTASSGFEK
jgi:hypothetical protein